MKLNYDRKSKNPTYFVQVGIRNGGKTTTKNIHRIGRHDELLKITDDPLAYAKKVVAEYNEKARSETVVISEPVDFSKKLTNRGDAASRDLTRNVGYLYLKKIYDGLGMSAFFEEIAAGRKFTFDPCLINMALTVFRILEPGSKLSTQRRLGELYGDVEFPYQHIPRFMDLLDDHYDEYLAHLFEASNKIVKRNASVCYFDCTNFYFEKESEDEDVYDEVTGELIKGLLKYGVSKEHRPNPIVQMGLFMDGDGIPLSMCINPGSDNESLCAVPAEKKMLRMFKEKDIIYCSDAGLGYYDARVFNDFAGRKFVVTQSVKKLSDTAKIAAFNDHGYRFSGSGEKTSLARMAGFDRKDAKNRAFYDGYAYKCIPVDKAVDVGLYEVKRTKGGKERKVKSKAELKQRVIVTYSRKMAEYQRTVRARQVERARKILESRDPASLRKGPNDAARFIKAVEKEKGSFEIDEEKIREEEKYDGFYAVATNIFDMDPRDVLKIMSERYRIEESFRIMKTNFDGRPVFHYTRKRIRAHFLICYSALLIYRLLETQLDRQGTHFTTAQILETLKNMRVLECDGIYYRACYGGSDALDSLERLYGLGLNKKYYQPKTLNKLLKFSKN